VRAVVCHGARRGTASAEINAVNEINEYAGGQEES
jgi:hypothetical protein